ncbi:PREDICTED: slowpoke-binding protein isoform X2 [Nicrophorus vespilloides]|uniref:Slowpoke-binding protein isoform X2 n=1 Tax=Nicrophorus vespilloides TaxID=110193 RepID=A0ABM1N6S5_NICVS|nr:PREDICTED: slowpoke-binding protein isoform X2 [Nicrophorus vespilloides]
MINLYKPQNRNKDEDGKDQDKKIGHDRFYQERSRSRRKKTCNRRVQSENNFNSSELRLARQMSIGRSSSIESPPSKWVNLQKVFLMKTRSTSMPRHEYSALRLENGSEKNSNDRHQQIQLQDATYTSCQQYLEYGGRYELQRRLGMMGSRPDKHWFVIKDKSLGAERLLSLVEVPQQCPLQTTATTRETMLELFRSLQHPYIHPILDVEFWDIGAAFICPLNYSGSLKDLIYGENWQEDHGRKYSGKGQGLPYRQVQCLGRQILEALLFLQNRNYPKFYHLHSGNVIIQNGVARIAAIENPLLGLPPKPPAVDECLAFGYLLFEMTTGYELPTPPSAAHLKIELERTPKIAETLWDIFESDSCPTIEELLRDDLFRGVELRELRRTTGISYVTSAEVNDLLESVKVAPLPTPITSDVECRMLEDEVDEELNKAETEETITVIIETPR